MLVPRAALEGAVLYRFEELTKCFFSKELPVKRSVEGDSYQVNGRKLPLWITGAEILKPLTNCRLVGA
jgi:hypothetical protein